MFKYSPYDKSVLAVDDNETKVTYGDGYKFALELKNYIPNRCLIFILSENKIESLLCYLACICNEIVPLLLDSSISTNDFNKIYYSYRPKFIWLSKNKLPKNISYKIVFEYGSFVLLKINEFVNYKINNDLALLLSTSGSTGSPKFVRLTYKNIYSNALSISEYLNLSKMSKQITTLPMNYSFGISIINSHFIVGAKLLITDKTFFEKKFWEFFKREEPNSISGVPYTFQILRKMKFLNMHFPFLKTITQAGGNMNNKLKTEYAEYAKKKGIDFFVMYGQTEASPRMSFLEPKFLFNKIDSIGRPIPGGEFFLVDEKNNKIEETNKIGELVYTGDNVCIGYSFNYKDLYNVDQNNRKLYTGDLASKDKDGYYYIKGRKNRFVKIYGNRINLDDVEVLIFEYLNNKQELACTGAEDKLKIFISGELEDHEKYLKKYISLKLNINTKAVEIKILTQIPKTKSGKTIYSKLT